MTLCEGVADFRRPKGTKKQMVARKFGMLSVGLVQNAVSIDELARKMFLLGHLSADAPHP